MATWQNWSGAVECQPHQIAQPQTERQLQDAVRAACEQQCSVRAVGSGHSFVPLCATDEVLVILDDYAGIEHCDQQNGVVTLLAGSKIENIGKPLAELGWALANQGDIDKQSISGAISTGTHGTGPTLGSLSTQLVGFRMVTSDGELIDVDAATDPEVFRAGQVSFGSLGIFSHLRLQVLPAYHLHERMWQIPIEDCLNTLNEHIAAHRHFEFFWYPQTDLAHMKSLDPVDATTQERELPEGEQIDASFRVFPTERQNKFNECEYAVPAEVGPDCFNEIRELMQNRYADIVWPVEYRTVASDDIYLSPAYGRETVTLSIHQAADLPYEAFFRDAETIFRRYQGRPHWGKIHSCTSDELSALYPKWDDFHRVRQQIDAPGRFLNPYLRRLFEIS